MLAAGIIATAIAGREGRYLPLVLTVVLYTLFLPIIVGLLLPANLFFLDVTGLSVVEVSVGEALSAWIWGTPFFVFTYALTGFKQAFWAGIASVVLAAGVFRFIGPNHVDFSVRRTAAVTTAVGFVVVAVIMFGPLGIFEHLFNEFRTD